MTNFAARRIVDTCQIIEAIPGRISDAGQTQRPYSFARRKLANMAEDKKRPEQSAARPGNNEISEAEIDQNLMGTFPASDPPSWTLGVERSEKSASEYSAEQR